MKSETPAERACAADALGELGPLAAPAVGALTAALDDSSLAVQIEALIALERIGPAAREAVPALVAVLKRDNSRIRDRAIEVLGAIGPDAVVSRGPDKWTLRNYEGKLVDYPQPADKDATCAYDEIYFGSLSS